MSNQSPTSKSHLDSVLRRIEDLWGGPDGVRCLEESRHATPRPVTPDKATRVSKKAARRLAKSKQAQSTAVYEKASDPPESQHNTQIKPYGSPVKGAKIDQNYNQYDYMSYIPLHNRYYSKLCIPPKRLQELREDLVIDRGPWVSKEERILRENWARICKYHPEFSDPKFAFASGHDGGDTLTLKEVKKIQQRYKKFEVMRRMAFGLNDRLICDIYAKCRTLIYYPSFKYSKRADVPKELDQVIKAEAKAGVPHIQIAEKYDVSPLIVGIIKRCPRLKTKEDDGINERTIWTPEATDHLELLVKQLYPPEEQEYELRARDIKWKKVAKEMRSIGFNVRRKNCRYKWTSLHPESVVRKYPEDESSDGSSEADVADASN